MAITGFPDYYSRFGFVKGKEVGIRYQADPEADYFLVKLFRQKPWMAETGGLQIRQVMR